MAKGVEVQLYQSGGTAPLASTAVKVGWFDTSDILDIPDVSSCVFNLTTDASGWLKLNLENISGLDTGETGFLIVYKEDLSDHRDSLVFMSKLTLTTVTGGQDPYTILLDSIPVPTRNPEWPAQVVQVDGTEKICLLLKIPYDDTYAYFTIKVSGNHVVDWGDGGGTVNIAAGTTTTKQFVYANIPGTIVGSSNTTAVTFTGSTDVVNHTNHGHFNGTVVSYSSISGTTGISNDTIYYVVNATTNTYQIANTFNGSALPLTGDGTGNEYIPEYKVAKVIITPDTGHNLTSFEVLRPVISGWWNGVAAFNASALTPILSVSINGINLTTIKLNSYTLGQQHNSIMQLEEAYLGENNCTDLSKLFFNAFKLKYVSRLYFKSTGCQADQMFSSCTSLEKIDSHTGKLGTQAVSMFSNCSNLKLAPILDTSICGSINGLFAACFNLLYAQYLDLSGISSTIGLESLYQSCLVIKTVPKLNIVTSGSSISYMFNSCFSLKYLPLIDLSNVAVMNSTFVQCTNLKTLPLFNTANVTELNATFSNCFALSNIPNFDLSSVTTANYAFSNCMSINTFETADMSSLTSAAGMFEQCTRLKYVDFGTTGALLYASDMFSYCQALYSIKGLKTNTVGEAFNMFNGCLSLEKLPPLEFNTSCFFNAMFSQCFSLKEITIKVTASMASSVENNLFDYCTTLNNIKISGIGLDKDFSVKGCALSAAQLDNLFTNALATVGAPGSNTQTIYIKSNPGTDTCTQSIAINKGWAVNTTND